MRAHNQESDTSALRPKASRVDEEPSGSAARAAAEGRADALSASDVVELQRLAGNAGLTSAVEEERSPVHDVISSPGSALDPAVRNDMEARLGHDFADVRVHDDGPAHASASSVNAHAYTVGSHVVFQRDAFDPSSTAGRQTLAHELTHVVQQRSGPVDGTATSGGISVSDPGDRFEREAAATAERAMATPGPDIAAAPVQRLDAEKEAEDPAASPVQRLEAEEEAEEAGE